MLTLHFPRLRKSSLVILALLLSSASFAAPPARKPTQTTARLSIKEISQFMELTKENMRKERTLENRRPHLRNAMEVLDLEFNKGAHLADPTFYYVNRLQVTIGFLLGNDCKQSYRLIRESTTGADSSIKAQKENARHIQEDLELHKAYCKNE